MSKTVVQQRGLGLRKRQEGLEHESVKISVVRCSDFQSHSDETRLHDEAVGISMSHNCAVLKCNVAASRFSNKILLGEAKFVGCPSTAEEILTADAMLIVQKY